MVGLFCYLHKLIFLEWFPGIFLLPMGVCWPGRMDWVLLGTVPAQAELGQWQRAGSCTGAVFA